MILLEQSFQSGAYMKFLNVTSSGQVLDAKGFIKDLLNILSWRMGFKCVLSYSV